MASGQSLARSCEGTLEAEPMLASQQERTVKCVFNVPVAQQLVSIQLQVLPRPSGSCTDTHIVDSLPKCRYRLPMYKGQIHYVGSP